MFTYRITCTIVFPIENFMYKVTLSNIYTSIKLIYNIWANETVNQDMYVIETNLLASSAALDLTFLSLGKLLLFSGVYSPCELKNLRKK